METQNKQNKQSLLKLTIEEYYEGDKRCFCIIDDETGEWYISKGVDENWLANHLQLAFSCREELLKSQGKLKVDEESAAGEAVSEENVVPFPTTKMA